MNIFRRLKNLWKLSEISDEKVIDLAKKEKEPVKMAQVIKMSDPIKEVLKND